MTKKTIIKKIIITTSLLLLLVFNLANAAGIGDAFSKPLQDAAGSKGAGYNDTPQMPTEIIANVINIFLSLLGVIFLILMIYAGYLWMTAAGEESKVEDAQKIIKAAIIGLIIVVGAYAISQFVVTKLGNIETQN